MASLPDDVMLTIVGKLDIDTFLTFRLTCRKYYSTIHAHMNGLTDEVARTTFPGQTRLLMRDNVIAMTPIENLRWLKGLRLRQLGTLVLATDAETNLSSVSAVSQTERLVRGWKYFDRMTQIDREVRSLPPADLPTRFIPAEKDEDDENPTREISPHVQHLLQQELEIARRRCFHIETSSPLDLQGFDAVIRLLKTHVLGYRESHPPFVESERYILEDTTFEWCLCKLLQSGAEQFWKVWWAEKDIPDRDHLAIKHNLERAWLNRDLGLEQALKDSAKLLWGALNTARSVQISLHGLAERQRLGHGYNASYILQRARDQKPFEEDAIEVQPADLLRNVLIEQKLDWKVMGEAPWARKDSPDHGKRHPRFRLAGTHTNGDNGEPDSPEFRELRLDMVYERRSRVMAFLTHGGYRIEDN